MAGHLAMRSGNPALTADTFATFPAVADDQAMTRETEMEQRFPPVVVLHPFAQGVSDQADVVFR